MSEHIKRIFCFTLAAVLLCALSACVSTPAVSEPESSAAAATAAATSAGTTAGTSAPTTEEPTPWSPPATTTGTATDPYPYPDLFSSEKEARATYEAYKKMSYEEYFSEPRPIIDYFRRYYIVVPLEKDPSKLVYEHDRTKVYFDAKKYKKDAKKIRGGYKGDDIVDFFCVDDSEIWRWHIPSDTVDVVVKHEDLYGVRGLGNDICCCSVYNHDGKGLPDKMFHYHVFSKNLTIPLEDVQPPLFNTPEDSFGWFMKNVYNKT